MFDRQSLMCKTWTDAQDIKTILKSSHVDKPMEITIAEENHTNINSVISPAARDLLQK